MLPTAILLGSQLIHSLTMQTSSSYWKTGIFDIFKQFLCTSQVLKLMFQCTCVGKICNYFVLVNICRPDTRLIFLQLVNSLALLPVYTLLKYSLTLCTE